MLGTMLIALSLISNPGPHVTVRPHQGAPTFFVGDAPFLIPCFETYTPKEHYFRQFAEAGVKLHSFNTNAAACDYGHSKPTWLEVDVWDYSNFIERCEAVLAADPDAMIIPRINLGTPLWWLEANPSELEVLASGSTLYVDPNLNPTLPKNRPFSSICSEKWREDMGMALARMMDFINNSPYSEHIFGYLLAGLDTEEWYHWSSGSDQLSGYSIPTRRAFQTWLKKRYRTSEGLQKAWGKPGLTFADVVVPSATERFGNPGATFRDPIAERHIIDWYLFYNNIVPETIDYFAAIIRSKTLAPKVIGAFYGYMYEFRGDPEYGHNALDRYLQSDNLDFIFVTASYDNRAFASGADYARSPAYTVRLHNKLWYHDNDVTSFLAPKVMKNRGMHEEGEWNTSIEHHLKVLGYTETAQETIWMYRRSMGFALCNGAYESFFDLHGGYYDHPELMAEVGRLVRLADQSKHYSRHSVSQILVISDEESCAYAGFQSKLLRSALHDTQPTFTKMGAPIDHILVNDLDLLDPAPYRLVIFLNCYHLSAPQRQMIENKILKNKRHVVWCYTQGLFDEGGSNHTAMEQLTGFQLMRPADPTPIGIQIEMADNSLLEEGTIVGTTDPIGELYHVTDPHATPLGHQPNTRQVTMAQKSMGQWESIYLGTANVSPDLYRRLAIQAGVHVFNQSNDTFYANQSFVCLHADGAGSRTLRFPRQSNIYNMISGDQISSETDAFTYDYQHGETLLLRWEPVSSSSTIPDPGGQVK